MALSQPVLASSCLLAEHRYSSYEAFKMRGKAVVIDSPKVFSMSEIVSRADSMVQKGPGRPKFGSYDAGSNNCEHFATWCRTDERSCGQLGAFAVKLIDDFASAGGGGRPAAGLMMAAGR